MADDYVSTGDPADDHAAELERLRQQSFAMEQARAMWNPRLVFCPTGAHPSFLVDSDEMVSCPWCELERLRAEIELHVEHEARVRDVVGEYVNSVESGEKFDALLALLEDTPATAGR